jgi:hypothetical protein
MGQIVNSYAVDALVQGRDIVRHHDPALLSEYGQSTENTFPWCRVPINDGDVLSSIC